MLSFFLVQLTYNKKLDIWCVAFLFTVVALLVRGGLPWRVPALGQAMKPPNGAIKGGGAPL